MHLTGVALGTTYRITYLAPERDDYGLLLTLLFGQFCQTLSVFEPYSEVSRFNRTGTLRFESPFLYPVLRASAEVVAMTDGAFDPTVGALVDAYGFGRAGQRFGTSDVPNPETFTTGFAHILFDDAHVERTHPEVQLNFNAIAKGYAVDVVGGFLSERGVQHYLIELGGEVRCQGLNQRGEHWRVGVDRSDSDGKSDTVVVLTNQSLATSGNYHNYYERNGTKYTHLLDPRTGRMVRSDLLSVTVVADDCMTADALATAFVVMGADQTAAFLTRHPRCQAYLFPCSTLAA